MTQRKQLLGCSWRLLWAGVVTMIFSAGCGGPSSGPGMNEGVPARSLPLLLQDGSAIADLPTTYQGLPLLGIPRVTGDPGIGTGDLSEPAWQMAATRTLVSAGSCEPMQLATEVKLFCTDQALYVGYRCAEPVMDKLVTTGEMWARDEVELFLEPAGSLVKRPYYQVLADVAGGHLTERYHVYPQWFSQRYGEEKWGAAVSSAAHANADGWTVVIRVPWDQLKFDAAAVEESTLWRLNLYRSRPSRGDDPWLGWAWSPPMTGSFHTPARFGYALPGVFATAAFVQQVQATAGAALPNQGVPVVDGKVVEAIEDKIQAVLSSTGETRAQTIADLDAAAKASPQALALVLAHMPAALKAYGEGNITKRAAQVELSALQGAAEKMLPEDPAPEEISEPVTRFVPAVFKDDQGGELPYRLRKPYDFAETKAYPLFIYLHGSGESGNDNIAQLHSSGFNMSRAEFRKRYPCYVLLPQCPKGTSWANVRGSQESMDLMRATSNYRFAAEPTMPMRCLLELIPQLLKDNPSIDPKRVYITGGSLGGFGTWDAIMRQPTWFAAASPSAGGGDETHVQDIVAMPIWIFHGGADQNVKTVAARNMRDALEKAGGHPKYTEYEGAGHGMSDRMYNDNEFLDWLFQQHRE